MDGPFLRPSLPGGSRCRCAEATPDVRSGQDGAPSRPHTSLLVQLDVVGDSRVPGGAAPRPDRINDMAPAAPHRHDHSTP